MQYPTKYGLNVSVEIVRDNQHAQVKVIAPIYINKEWLMPHSYSLEFSDHQIMHDSDFIRVMLNHYPT
jgi:hypothetical protein